jgi:hypothetical protein
MAELRYFTAQLTLADQSIYPLNPRGGADNPFPPGLLLRTAGKMKRGAI